MENYTYKYYYENISQNIVVEFDRIFKILQNNVHNLNTNIINCTDLANQILNRATENMTLDELYYLISDHCASLITFHPDYNKMAARVAVERSHLSTPENYYEVVYYLYNNIDKHGNVNPLISEKLYNVVLNNKDKIQQAINFDNDYKFDYFGIRTLERSYLYRIHNSNISNYKKNEKIGQIIERPQHLIMRVALGIHFDDLDAAFETYNLISNKYFTHATPTLFNAGSPCPQLASCYLLTMYDNIEHIFKTITNSAFISKRAGGLGLCISHIRAKDSLIRGTNGYSDGIIPLCVLLDKLGKYVNQGGKRNGSLSVYVEPWHADIYGFCELKKNTGDENLRARDLFLALWIPDLFMKRVLKGEMWSLMCPDECPGLVDTYGEEFEKLYIQYEQQHRFKKQVKAIDLWYHILECQIETGVPYMMFKDNVNRKSNQQNLGTIKCSNLCSEIVQYTSQDEIAVCNLSSICLPSFLKYNDNTIEYDFNKLGEVARVCVKNLNKIIDINYYPTPETKVSNMKHRPIGIGVQGLADLFNILELPFGSEKARKLNKKIFETIYFNALDESCELAKKYGTYQSFDGSPFSQGKLQWHMWGLTKSDLLMNYDWDSLIEKIKIHGTRNSLLTTVMPTASTAQIMSCSECIEPYMSNVYTRSTLAGEFPVINENLVKTLVARGIWSDSIRKKIVAFQGSVQKITEIPDDIKEIYKVAFEIYQKDIIDLSAERGPFIDQSQSLNLFMDNSDFDILTNCHLHSWESGLKTGMYYLRSRPAVDPIQFGIDIDEFNQIVKEIEKETGEIIPVDFINDDIEQLIIEAEKNENLIKYNSKRGVDLKECEACSS